MFKILFFIFSFVFFVENSFAVIVDLGLPEDLFSISSEWQIKDNLLQAGDTKLIDINNIATIFTSPNFEVNFFKNIEFNCEC